MKCDHGQPRLLRRVPWGWLLLILFSAFTLGGCGNGGGHSKSSDNDEGIVSVAVTKLSGDDNANALAATFDLAANHGVATTSIEADATGARVARTELEVWFTTAATVGQINNMLATYHASVVNMLKGVPAMVIHIPDPGSHPALDAIMAEIKALPGIEDVVKSPLPLTDAVPDNVADDHGGLNWDYASVIDSHLAIGASGAWNVRKALERPGVSPPRLLIVDAFGAGPPLADFDVLADSSEYERNYPADHGYAVLSVISADYGGADTDRGWVTGIYPGQLTVEAVDLQQILQGVPQERGWADIEFEILAEVIRQAGSPTIVNTSFGFPCETQAAAAALCAEDYAHKAAVRWIRKVRGRGLETHFIQATSAGNIQDAVPGNTDARYDSSFTAAALLQDLQLPDGTLVAPLANTLVVEDLAHSTNYVPDRPVCMSSASKWPGNIGAIGTDVSVLLGPVEGFDSWDGTSFSTPQVAGLAAYIWALAPSLTNFQVIDLLKNTAQDVAVNATLNAKCGTVQPAPAIDAFTALLGLDSPTDLTRGASTPIRLALLDVDNDGNFDEDDISAILEAFDNHPENPNYGRYDLNGDGDTGGGNTRRFDLNINAQFDTASYAVEGDSVDVDEQKVTDTDVLCYYANSPLYDGLTDERDTLLKGRCRFDMKIIVGTPYDQWTAYAISADDTNNIIYREPVTGLPHFTVGPDCSVNGAAEVNAGESKTYSASWQNASGQLALDVTSDGGIAHINFGTNMNEALDGVGRIIIGGTSVSSDYQTPVYLLINNPGQQNLQLRVNWMMSADISSGSGSQAWAAFMNIWGNVWGNRPNVTSGKCGAAWRLFTDAELENDIVDNGYYLFGNGSDSAADMKTILIPPGKHLAYIEFSNVSGGVGNIHTDGQITIELQH